MFLLLFWFGFDPFYITVFNILVFSTLIYYFPKTKKRKKDLDIGKSTF